ncbi:thiamine phosphate synthase [Dongia rigui]|uniref:Thiamine-phosphate synthase n=1 Tax=Dongia rigui TaxID=940149 RepID=A0ABU5DV55_9PROT|nr:thiamine phosphate synthase [Dongia rigui]MDY0870481.1 thiamine phosphate synthase [Dongia rigui]
MTSLDLSLYLVADQEFCRPGGIERIVAAAIDGGASMVQLRGTRTNLRQFLTDALALRALTRRAGIPLIINDHIDIALAAGADGVHVGQADMPAPFARQLLGKDKIIGLSVTCTEDISERDLVLVDYVGLGPVFPTRSKTDAAPALGLQQFAILRSRIALPVVAIGGINLSNAGSVMAAGADGVAVVSAICSAPNPRQATMSLRQCIEEAWQ